MLDQKIESGTTLKLDDFPEDDIYCLDLVIHNASDRVYRGHGQDLGLIAPAGLSVYGPGPFGQEEALQVKLPDGQIIHTFESPAQLLPDAWEPIPVHISLDPESELWSNPLITVVVRLFTDTGPRDLQVDLAISRAVRKMDP
jgi:hypothetical protein